MPGLSSAVPRGFGGMLHRFPSAEALGYIQPSLRDYTDKDLADAPLNHLGESVGSLPGLLPARFGYLRSGWRVPSGGDAASASAASARGRGLAARKGPLTPASLRRRAGPPLQRVESLTAGGNL